MELKADSPLGAPSLQGTCAICHESCQSSADFQSAVSQNCILPSVRTLEAHKRRCPADYKSAIQQIENLRYFVTGPAICGLNAFPPWAMLLKCPP